MYMSAYPFSPPSEHITSGIIVNTVTLAGIETSAYCASDRPLLDLEVDCVSTEDFSPNLASNLWRKVR